jgi:lysophospholipase L1-like esterase
MRILSSASSERFRLAALLLSMFAVSSCGGRPPDSRARVVTWNYYVAMGDSITAATGDDFPGDDTSLDGKTTGGGFEPILNNRLTAFTGHPQTVVDAGVGGTTSADGVALIPTLLQQNPGAQIYLVMYGMNDARPSKPVPSGLGLNPGDPGYAGSYKDHMQQIVEAINNSGGQVALAKIPIALGDCNDPAICPPYPDPNTGARSLNIQQYNKVIDELVAAPANHITITPPDFYSYFAAHYQTEYSDNIHPNGIGYQSMASLWFQALTQ